MDQAGEGLDAQLLRAAVTAVAVHDAVLVSPCLFAPGSRGASLPLAMHRRYRVHGPGGGRAAFSSAASSSTSARSQASLSLNVGRAVRARAAVALALSA